MTIPSILSAIAVPALLAWTLYPAFTSFPPPYSSRIASPIDDASRERFPPFPPDLTGPYEPNELLKKHVTPLFRGRVDGAESVAVAPGGTLIMLDRYGYVHRAREIDGAYKLFEDGPPIYVGPGRPLGFHVADAGRTLLVCDSLKGLTEVDLRAGSVSVLSNSDSSGTPINYANDLDVAADGTVYFTSSTLGVVSYSDKYGYYDTMRSFLLNMMSGDRSGRLLAYHPKTKSTMQVMDDIWYANGVTLSHDGDSVLVVETMGFRVLKHHLRGPKRGQTETLIDKLPGFPDGISRSSDGNYWLPLVAPLSPLLRTLGWGDAARHAVARLLTTESVTKRVVKSWGCVLKVSPEGEVLATLMDPRGETLSTVSSVTEHDGRLFLGNLKGDFVSVVSLKDAGM